MDGRKLFKKMGRDRGFSYESSASDPTNAFPAFGFDFAPELEDYESSAPGAFNIGAPPPGIYGESFAKSRSVVVRGRQRRTTLVSQASSVRSLWRKMQSRGWALRRAMRRL